MDAHLLGHVLLRILPRGSQGDHLAVPVEDALADAETWAAVLGVSKVFGGEAARGGAPAAARAATAAAAVA